MIHSYKVNAIHTYACMVILHMADITCQIMYKKKEMLCDKIDGRDFYSASG